MEVGVVTAFDLFTHTGVISTSEGNEYSFAYQQGQNQAYGPGLDSPVFSGRHEQPAGFGLKLPRPGDPVLFQLSASDGISVWGYLRHYLDLAEHRHGTQFVSTSLDATAAPD